MLVGEATLPAGTFELRSSGDCYTWFAVEDDFVEPTWEAASVIEALELLLEQHGIKEPPRGWWTPDEQLLTAAAECELWRLSERHHVKLVLRDEGRSWAVTAARDSRCIAGAGENPIAAVGETCTVLDNEDERFDIVRRAGTTGT